MALKIFTVFAEARSDGRAFDIAVQSPAMMGRTRYQLMDTVLFPSDKIAAQVPESVFGVQPQADKVSIAGAHTNTVWAIRVLTQNPGMKRLMFFGVRRTG
tara:strand:- start:42 stop:341 length:300 start_codon:yes stop_codon:yes gene_type:complete